METMTIEITDDMKRYLDRQIASGGFKDGSAVVRALFSVVLLADRREEIDQKLLDADAHADRGDCVAWQPGSTHELLRQITRDREGHGQT
jgi:Arc/MetJ-type ribon-helix-helix transcriptional regulator